MWLEPTAPDILQTQPRFLSWLAYAVSYKRGWLTTIRFVIHTHGDGMEPMIFWGPNGPGAFALSILSKAHQPWSRWVTGADQYDLTVNRKEGNNGCEDGEGNEAVLLADKWQVKKNVNFFNGEVFFLLTRPLMGDPKTTQENWWKFDIAGLQE
jgi:hypothetical protein